MSTFHLAEEMYVNQREDRETNTHEDRTSQKFVFTLLLLIDDDDLPTVFL
jgi:hypothetical protein